MRRFDHSLVSRVARTASRTFRSRVWRGCLKYRFLMSCWVMVEPPWSTWPASTFSTNARTAERTSTPGLV